jgi:hypothetical protein
MVNDLTLAVFGDAKLNETMTFKDALSLLADLELLNVGELAEQAVSKKSGFDQAQRCQIGCDLINGWEIKHGQARARKTARRAFVAGFENKTGVIRVIITELLTGRLYFFKIPYRHYYHSIGSSMNFDFDLDGTPRRRRLKESKKPNPWDCEVASFEELCK